MSDQLNLEAERAAPCPWCGEVPDVSNNASFRLTDGVKYGALQCCVVGPEVRTDYKDVPHWKAKAIAAWNDRRASPVGEVELPPLPTNVTHVTRRVRRCESDVPAQLVLEHFAMEYAKSAIAPYAERIRVLERELAERKRGGWIGSVGDYTQFHVLLTAVCDAAKELEDSTEGGAATFAAADKLTAAQDALIAHIDGRTAGTVPADPFAGQRFLNWNRSQDKPPVAIGKELGVARKVLEFAAAPTPMNSGKEEAN